MMNVLFIVLAGLCAYATEEQTPEDVSEATHRSSPPEVVFAEAIELPEWVTLELSTGATLYFSPQKGLRKATIRVDVLQGHLDIDPRSTLSGVITTHYCRGPRIDLMLKRWNCCLNCMISIFRHGIPTMKLGRKLAFRTRMYRLGLRCCPPS